MPHIIKLFVALVAFAANSFFCRFALSEDAIDPGAFTLIRLVSGAVTLSLILMLRRQWEFSFIKSRYSWLSGTALFGYAICFSFAYTQLTTGTGALILFGMVQLSLVAVHLLSGNRLTRLELFGVSIALLGFIVLMLPSAQTPDLGAAALMLVSGVCWAVFTLMGRGSVSSAVSITQGFVVASLLALLTSPLLVESEGTTKAGVYWALMSGVFASGLGYVLWYQVVKKLTVLQTSVAQLAVPVIAFAAGSIGLAEPITLLALLSSSLVLGGIGLLFVSKAKM